MINPFTSTGEGVTVFTSAYLSAGAPVLGEAKGLIYTDYVYLFFHFFLKKLLFLSKIIFDKLNFFKI